MNVNILSRPLCQAALAVGLLLITAGCFKDLTPAEIEQKTLYRVLRNHARPGNYHAINSFYLRHLKSFKDQKTIDVVGVCIQDITGENFGFPTFETTVPVYKAIRKVELWWEAKGHEMAIKVRGKVLVDNLGDALFPLEDAFDAELLRDEYPRLKGYLKTTSYNQLRVLSENFKTDLTKGLQGNKQMQFRSATLLTRSNPKHRKALEAFSQWTQDDMAEVKWRSILELLKGNHPAGMQSINRELKSEEGANQLSAAITLFPFDPARAEKYLVTLLKHEDKYVQEDAAWRADMLGCRGAVPNLIQNIINATSQTRRTHFIDSARNVDLPYARNEMMKSVVEDRNATAAKLIHHFVSERDEEDQRALAAFLLSDKISPRSRNNLVSSLKFIRSRILLKALLKLHQKYKNPENRPGTVASAVLLRNDILSAIHTMTGWNFNENHAPGPVLSAWEKRKARARANKEYDYEALTQVQRDNHYHNYLAGFFHVWMDDDYARKPFVQLIADSTEVHLLKAKDLTNKTIDFTPIQYRLYERAFKEKEAWAFAFQSRLFKAKNPTLKARAFHVLWQTGRRQYLGHAFEFGLKRGEKTQVRAAASRLLKDFTTPADAATLVDLLHNKDNHIRKAADQALKRIDCEGAIKQLIDAVANKPQDLANVCNIRLKEATYLTFGDQVPTSKSERKTIVDGWRTWWEKAQKPKGVRGSWRTYEIDRTLKKLNSPNLGKRISALARLQSLFGKTPYFGLNVKGTSASRQAGIKAWDNLWAQERKTWSAQARNVLDMKSKNIFVVRNAYGKLMGLQERTVGGYDGWELPYHFSLATTHQLLAGLTNPKTSHAYRMITTGILRKLTGQSFGMKADTSPKDAINIGWQWKNYIEGIQKKLNSYWDFNPIAYRQYLWSPYIEEYQ